MTAIEEISHSDVPRPRSEYDRREVSVCDTVNRVPSGTTSRMDQLVHSTLVDENPEGRLSGPRYSRRPSRALALASSRSHSWTTWWLLPDPYKAKLIPMESPCLPQLETVVLHVSKGSTSKGLGCSPIKAVREFGSCNPRIQRCDLVCGRRRRLLRLRGRRVH
jgi:hypothetical protein